MYFRCTSCLSATWIESDRPTIASDSLRCEECGRTYIAHPVAELGSTSGSHYRRTSDFASTEQLDMATAYSFLLGLITREELSAVENFEMEEPALDEEEQLLLDNLGPTPSEPEAELTKSAEPAVAREAFDPGFQKAVARGRLTIEEAIRRGDRSAYAENLARRYKLSVELAYAVADNRITLFQARKRQESEPAPTAQGTATPSGGSGRAIAVIGCVAAVIIAVGWGIAKKDSPSGRARASSSTERSSTTTGSASGEAGASSATRHSPSSVHALTTPSGTGYSTTQILTDDKGRVTKIAGLDARTVLHAYCGAESDSMTCEPLEIIDTLPPSREVRLGLFRASESDGELQAIRIVRDRFSRRWTAGNGEQPIPSKAAPALPAGSPTLASK